MSELNLNSYHGIVLNRPLEEIPVLLAREILRVGKLDLAGYQRFQNHNHFCYHLGDVDFRNEVKQAEIWRDKLSASRLGRFVIEYDSTELVSWYQLLPGVKSEDEEEWCLYQITVAPLEPIVDNNTKERMLNGGIPVEEYISEVQRIKSLYRNRKGSDGPCEQCRREAGFTEPIVDLVHRGVKTMDCMYCCLLYTSPSPRDGLLSRMPSSA